MIYNYNMACETKHGEKLNLTDKWPNTRCRGINYLTRLSTVAITRDVRYVLKRITALKCFVRFCG